MKEYTLGNSWDSIGLSQLMQKNLLLHLDDAFGQARWMLKGDGKLCINFGTGSLSFNLSKGFLCTLGL